MTTKNGYAISKIAAFDEPKCWIAIYMNKLAMSVNTKERAMKHKLDLSSAKVAFVIFVRKYQIGSNIIIVKKECISSKLAAETLSNIFWSIA